MKTIKIKFSILAAVIFTLGACTKNFEEINTNPNAATSISEDFLFSHSQTKTSTSGDFMYENWRANLIYCESMIQHIASIAGYWVGDKYFYNPGYSASLFDKAYTNELKDLIAVLDQTRDDPALVNKYAAARIWKVVIFQRLTDLYGDIPYSEAGLGYDKQIYKPAYDRQQDIYMDMLNELDQACSSFDASKVTFGSADLVYGGDVDKWKRFGYSMMLRLGMRLSKVDPTTAQSWVQSAISGGVMQSNDDNCFIQMADGPTDLNVNGNAKVFQVEFNPGGGEPRLSKTYVDFLKNNGDPRLRIYGELPDGNTDPAAQQGLPNGSDATTTPDVSIYTRPNINTVGVLATPMYFQTYAEVEFMLAEAAVRGWGASDPATHYNNGVTAAMLYVNTYANPAEPVTQAEVDAYLAAHPYDAAGDQLGQINTQYWAATFLNGYEAFANYRRSGYPLLTPVNYPGNVTNGTIPRRLQYPQSEYSNNPAGIAASLSNQGPDLLTTPVWWDKQ